MPSAWDDIVARSHQATRGCQYVAYFGNFSQSVDSLYEPRSLIGDLCRVAFVSGQSLLVKDAVMKSANRNLTEVPADLLKEYNGRIKSNGWTLVWIPNHDDETLSDADNALPLVDPSRLFADSVQKAIFLGSSEFARTSNNMLLRVFLHMDRVKLEGHAIKEKRPGTQVSRWVPQPPERARRAILFAGEPPDEDMPDNASDFVDMLDAKDVVSTKQLAFYQQAAHLIQTNDMRPEYEIRQTVYPSFPFQWTRLSIIIHDFTMDESRQLRCDWLDEHLFWGQSRNLEELSLAYVIARRRIEGSLGPSTNEDGDTSWNPLWRDTGDEYDPKERVVTEQKTEAFLRVMPRGP